MQSHPKILLLLLLFLSACSTVPPVQDPLLSSVDKQSLWQQRQVQLNAIAAFAMKGRLGIKTPEDAWSVSLQWAQKEQLYKMRIIAPLGQGTYELTGGNGQVSLLTAEDESYEADDPDTLMQATLGWSVPVTGMRYWIIGLPDPEISPDSIQLDDMGRVTQLEQDGWSVEISRYQDYEHYQLPAKIKMVNQSLQVRIVIKNWVRVL